MPEAARALGLKLQLFTMATLNAFWKSVVLQEEHVDIWRKNTQ